MEVLTINKLKCILKKEELPEEQIERILGNIKEIPVWKMSYNMEDIQDSIEKICEAGK